MRLLTTLVLVWVTSIAYAQYNIDFENAPKNNIPYQYHKSHFNVKGPVKVYKKGMTAYTFDENGLLLNSSNKYMTTTFTYDGNKPIKITTKIGSESEDLLKVDNLNRLVQKGDGYGIQTYLYDAKGNFKETHDRKNTIKPSTDRYTYDAKNRLIKQEYFAGSSILSFTRELSYSTENNILKITTKHTDENNKEKNRTFVQYYKNGYLFDPNQSGDLKFDTYGNVTEYQPHLNEQYDYKTTYVYF